MAAKGATYNDPINGSDSTVGGQINVQYYWKKALIEARKEQYFSQLADVQTMPKNFGKTIKAFHYMPLLDDQNLNDQGLDAAGAVITTSQYFAHLPELVTTYAVEADATAAAAAINAIDAGVAVKTGSATPWTVTNSKLDLKAGTLAQVTTLVGAVKGATYIQGSGNIYGSTKDVGMIAGKLPLLSETGGRVNRVGFTRKEIEGSFQKFGFFHEWSQESVDFDTDAELQQHIQNELVNGASEVTEDALQIDLLNAAGVVKFAGDATTTATLNAGDVVSYSDLMHLSIQLDQNRTPKATTIITGSRMVDTRTIDAARFMFIGSELLPTLKAMKDLHNNPAFVHTYQYGDAVKPITGEVGSIDQFRFVVVPEMMKWANAGALASDATYYAGDSRYDVFPMLCIGDASFTTIGFNTDGKSVKFKTYTKMPGEETADRNDPYGEMGFSSIKWYYGFMILRPERIALIKTLAKL